MPQQVRVAAPHLKVRFWWDGYDPERLLTDPAVYFGLEHKNPHQWKMRVMTPKDGAWRSPRNRLGKIIAYIEDQDLHVHDVTLVTSRRRGGWEGLFEVSFGIGEPERPEPEVFF
jgi:hypothetical protein